jgi:hypothetical protein
MKQTGKTKFGWVKTGRFTAQNNKQAPDRVLEFPQRIGEKRVGMKRLHTILVLGVLAPWHHGQWGTETRP